MTEATKPKPRDWLPTSVTFAIALVVSLVTVCNLAGCAGFTSFVELVDPRLAACEQYKERDARADCIEAIVDGVEDALQLARDRREQNR